MDWYVVSKTGQVVASLLSAGKPDLSVYYEHPELYDVTTTPSLSALVVYRKFWQQPEYEKGERRVLGA